jgi:hypothetical protein
MMMLIPIAGLRVDLHISGPDHIVDTQSCVEIIRTTFKVSVTGMQNFELITIRQTQIGF